MKTALVELFNLFAAVSVDFMRSLTHIFLLITLATSVFCSSSIIAVFCKQKFTTLGTTSRQIYASPFGTQLAPLANLYLAHHKSLDASQSIGSILTWWNIDFMSATRSTVSWLKQLNIPTIRLDKSEPCSNCWFKEVFANWAAQSKTTRTFSVLKGCITGRWGKYHSGRSTKCSLLVGTLSAWPCSMYLENKSWSLRDASSAMQFDAQPLTSFAANKAGLYAMAMLLGNAHRPFSVTVPSSLVLSYLHLRELCSSSQQNL